MKRLWKQYADRIDAATLRERVMMFAGAVVVIIALLNALLIEPELATQRRLSREIGQRQTEIKVLQVQLETLARARKADPDQADRHHRLQQGEAGVVGAGAVTWSVSPPHQSRQEPRRCAGSP